VIDIRDVVAGESYACRFRTTVFFDTQGQPMPNESGTTIAGPGEYEGFGVLKQRDLEQELVIVIDQATEQEFVVDFADIWDVDRVEWQEPNT